MWVSLWNTAQLSTDTPTLNNCLSVYLCSLFPSLVLVWSYYHINVFLFVSKEQWFDSLQITVASTHRLQKTNLIKCVYSDYTVTLKLSSQNFWREDFKSSYLFPPNILLFKGVARYPRMYGSMYSIPKCNILLISVMLLIKLIKNTIDIGNYFVKLV